MTGNWCVISCRQAGRSRLVSWEHCTASEAFPMPPSSCESCWFIWLAAVLSKKWLPPSNRKVGVISSRSLSSACFKPPSSGCAGWPTSFGNVHPTPALPHGYRVRAIDATTVTKPGSLGTDWRIHFSVNLVDLQCDLFQVTDAHGGEIFRRIPVTPGDLVLGDRCYGTPSGSPRSLRLADTSWCGS